MPVNLRQRSFLKELDFTPEQWRYLLDLAAALKTAKRAGTERPRLRGKNIALIFEKTSTRTRCAFEVAAYDQGARCTYLDPAGSQMGHKESIGDTAAVLGRFFDGIEYRGSAHERVEQLAALSGVPVWNGLTDEWHPTQSLCDALTMREHAGGKPDREISFAYVGDARNNVANSMLVMGGMLGMDVRMVAPASLQPAHEVVQAAKEYATRTGARITVTDEIDAGIAGVDFVHTDVWVSMGEPQSAWDERVEMLRPYRIDASLLKRTGNEAVRFMHCLPAYHDRHSAIGRELSDRYGLNGIEVDDEVFGSEASIVFDQAENRLHTIKAVMVATLGD